MKKQKGVKKMSEKLYWKPLMNNEKQVGGVDLKDIVDFEWGPRCTLDSRHIPTLKGLALAKIEGAQDLIDAIEKHEEIDVFISN